jgi:cobalt/nickel transport protein
MSRNKFGKTEKRRRAGDCAVAAISVQYPQAVLTGSQSSRSNVSERLSPVLAFLTCSVWPLAAHAQCHILTLDKPSVAVEQAVTCSLRFGHPFKHQILTAQKPARVAVKAPDGSTADLSAKVERVENTGPNGREIVAFQWKYTPAQRGDYLVTVETQPIWIPEQSEFVVDSVKTILHVETQNGWEARAGLPLELVPLTRPYGLRTWLTFQALVVGKGADDRGRGEPECRPVQGILVEVERLNPSPPQDLPPPEHITRTVRTDPVGVATTTLTEGGWWSLTAVRDGGTRERAGRTFPVKLRSTLWIYVDEKVPLISGQ